MSSRDYFDGVAERWEAMREGFFGDEVREAAYARADLTAGALAVDIGAGSGFMTEGLLARGLRVVAVDQSSVMVERLRARFGAAANLRLIVADGHALPLLDGSADYVFANMYLHHAESPPRALGEMARVLREGGELVITDLDRHDHDWLLREHHDRWPGFEREELLAWLRDAGFADATIEDSASTCRAASERDASHAAVSIFLAYGTAG